MISAIRALALNNRAFLQTFPLGNTAPASEPTSGHEANPTETDVLSLSRPESSAAEGLFSERVALRLRSDSRVMDFDDGRHSERHRTQLRFAYEFEAADGTKINIRAKANLRYSETENGDGSSQKLRIRAKAHISIMQQNVGSDAAPLFETPGTDPAAQTAVAKALDLFQQVTDAASSLFLESDSLDGDSLITGIVDAFNELSESLETTFLPTSGEPQAIPPGNIVEQPEFAVRNPSEAIPVETPAFESPAPTAYESESQNQVAPQVTARVGEPTSEGAEAQEGLSTTGNESPADIEPVEPSSAEQLGPDVRSVMLRLRFQVMQSLTSLVGEFGPGSSDALLTRSVFQGSAKFAARYQFATPVIDHSASDVGQIDVEA